MSASVMRRTGAVGAQILPPMQCDSIIRAPDPAMRNVRPQYDSNASSMRGFADRP